jgi:inhibitor of KinA
MEIVRLSENALLFRGGPVLRELPAFPGLLEVVPAYDSYAVYFDLAICSAEVVQEAVSEAVAGMEKERSLREGKTVEIPVVYDGPDLEEVANLNGLSVADVIRIHTDPIYEVAMVGFVPGFAFLRGLDERLTTPRRAEPRTMVPAGSVGIGGNQTGVYPDQTPGGWQLIGRTHVQFFDASWEAPSLLRAGDVVRFVAVDVLEGDTQ